MAKELQPTTILRGVLGIPEVRVVAQLRQTLPEGEIKTKNALQQATAGRLPEQQLDDLQAKQRAQRKAALGW